MGEKVRKTPEYTRRAIEKYRAGKDQIAILLPIGYKSWLAGHGMSAGAYARQLVMAAREAEEAEEQDSGTESPHTTRYGRVVESAADLEQDLRQRGATFPADDGDELPFI